VTLEKDWVISGTLVILFSYQFFFLFIQLPGFKMLSIPSVKYQDHFGISRLHSVNNRKEQSPYNFQIVRPAVQ
jgi:hypothetical protein